LWVADSENNSVTELNSANGDLIRVLGARTDSFDEPVAITYYKTRLWVVNLQGNSVTELNSSTGDLIRVISGPNYRFRGPNAIASGNGRVWITSGQDNSVTEINALSGALIAVFDSPASDFDDPASVITFGGQAWIANAHFPDDSIVKISIAGGALSRLQPKRNDDDGPDCVAINDDKLWVSNSGGIVSEFEAGSGSLIRVVSAREDELRDPVAIAVGGSLVWIANGTYNTVTVLNARSGDLIKVLK
jgi:streptogramin lyase